MDLIVISETLGAGGEKIARKLTEELQYDFFGKKELEKVAADMGILSDVQKLYEAKTLSKFSRFFEEKPDINTDRIQSVIREMAEKSDVIILVSGTKLLPRSFHRALHILVTGSMEKRMERVIEEKKVVRELSAKMVSQSDSHGSRVVKYVFNEDWLNPSLYDLILNTDRLDGDSAVKMIIQAIQSEAINRDMIEAGKTSEGSPLPLKIESTLREAGVPNPSLLFTLQNTDSIRLHGIVYSLEEKQKIERIVKGIKEIKNVANELAIFTGEE